MINRHPRARAWEVGWEIVSESGYTESQGFFERDVQFYLADNLASALNEHLELVGKEVPVPFGRVDIVARDARGSLVAIELKVGTASRDAVGQLQSYMGALEAQNHDTFVRGILVAEDLDDKAKAALRVVRNIQFAAYQISFKFSMRMSSPDTYDAWLAKKPGASKLPQQNSSRFCSRCREVTPTREQVNGRTYEYKCLKCGEFAVFRG